MNFPIQGPGFWGLGFPGLKFPGPGVPRGRVSGARGSQAPFDLVLILAVWRVQTPRRLNNLHEGMARDRAILQLALSLAGDDLSSIGCGTAYWHCHLEMPWHTWGSSGESRGKATGDKSWEPKMGNKRGSRGDRNRGGRAASVEGVAATRRSQRGRKRSQRVVKGPQMSRTKVSKKGHTH